MQHAQEAHKGDGNEGSPIPKQGHQGLDNRDRDNGPALAGLDSLPLVVDLPGRPKAGLELREPILSRGNGIDQEIARKAGRVKVEAVSAEGQGKRGPRGGNTGKGKLGLISKPKSKGSKALAHPKGRGRCKSRLQVERATGSRRQARRARVALNITCEQKQGRSHRPRGRENLEEATCTSKRQGREACRSANQRGTSREGSGRRRQREGWSPGLIVLRRDVKAPRIEAARLEARCSALWLWRQGSHENPAGRLLESRGPHVQGA